MDPRDDDIDFDFFDEEPATTEAQAPSRVRLPRRGGRGSGGFRRPTAPHGLTPLLRLLAVIAILIAILVFFGLVIQSCASTSKHDQYAHYVDKVAAIAHSSAADGASVADALTTPGVKVADLRTKLAGIAELERQNVNAAERLKPPGPLRTANQFMVEALQLRVSGVQGLADSFELTTAKKVTGTAATLSDQAARLLASDVVWDDSFQAPAAQVMKSKGVSGVNAPESHFVTNHDLISERSMSLVLQRLSGTTTGTPTGVHGTNIVSVKAVPGGPTLSTSTDLNTVTASTNLGFDVVVHDGGNSQEVGIKVTLTIQRVPATGTTVVKTTTIDVINPTQDVTVHFTNVDVGKLLAEKAKLTVDVAPVPGEAKRSNNSASFPVIFSLG
jgi:hypothetical protein